MLKGAIVTDFGAPLNVVSGMRISFRLRPAEEVKLSPVMRHM